MTIRRAWLTTAALFSVIGGVLSGCAPHAPVSPNLDVHERRTRFESALRDRREKVERLDADVSLWAKLKKGDSPPGASGRLTLVRPGAFRLRVESLFGTALDATARGESLVVQVPAWDLAAVADSALRAREVGPVVYQTLSATWEPPQEAWEDAQWEDSLCVLSWAADRDSFRMAVGSNGLPARFETRLAGGQGLDAHYERWGSIHGASWPMRMVVEDTEGRLKLTMQLGATHVSDARSSPLTMRVPAGAMRLTPERWHFLLGRLSRGLGVEPPTDEIPDGS
jgi:hypothetical protein